MITFPRILLIDDDPFWLESLAEFLRRKGFHVMEARDAMEGLERLETGELAERPSLILLDLNLPKVHGIQVLAALRKSKSCGDVPVIVVTSSDCAVRTCNSMAAYVTAKTGLIGLTRSVAVDFGRDNIRLVDTDSEFAILPDALEAAITADRAAGLTASQTE